MIKIMLDAGHYGKYNRSPSVPEYWESDMSWKLHLKLKAELEKYGIFVGTTRKDKEADLDVYFRGQRAKGYDMFISLHSNAVGKAANENIDHPIVIRQYADTDSEAWCQEVSNTISKLMNTKEPGRTGTRIQSSGAEYYGVLRGSKSVGCTKAYIIEHGFHTATAPSKWLLIDSNLDKLAVAEARLIAKKFGIEKKEEDDMTDERVREIIEEEKKKEIIHFWRDLPDWSKQTVLQLFKAGVFNGASASDLNLSPSDIKALCYVARAVGLNTLPKLSDEEIKKYFG